MGCDMILPLGQGSTGQGSDHRGEHWPQGEGQCVKKLIGLKINLIMQNKT
jgi:hypothetical protein